jgi:predicted ATP-grasp superfamily ATP-dependent carboligase
MGIMVVIRTAERARRMRLPLPTACVLGDLDMVAPLALAGIGVSLAAPPGDPARYTRRADYVGWADPAAESEKLLSLLLEHARRQPEKPVLYYQSDASALFVGRHRAALTEGFEVLIAEQHVLEALLDKLHFRDLAARLDLPVPASALLAPHTQDVPDLPFPLLVKPAGRDADWVRLEPAGKALRVDTPADLAALRPRLDAYGRTVLLQQLVEGPETRIESYHCYVDAGGGLVADFTGRKIRTRPVEFGRTTAATITDTADVRELGRRIVGRLGLCGVAKLDFKRDDDGRLWLLEVNPRYTLWLHPGARAGVNIPAMVWADLTGRPRPPAGPIRPGVSWCSSWDLQAARQWDVPLRQWVRWAVRCEARSMIALDDPLPLLRLALVRARRGLRRAHR